MSVRCQLFGCITAPQGWHHVEGLNAAAIERLPETDRHPWLIRSMFGGPSVQSFRDSSWSFATVLDGSEWDKDWPRWVTKFETLLASM